jgi:hypothetical protein
MFYHNMKINTINFTLETLYRLICLYSIYYTKTSREHALNCPEFINM